jgi:hypothetical protein
MSSQYSTEAIVLQIGLGILSGGVIGAMISKGQNIIACLTFTSFELIDAAYCFNYLKAHTTDERSRTQRRGIQRELRDTPDDLNQELQSIWSDLKRNVRSNFNHIKRDIQRELRDTPDDFNQELQWFCSDLRRNLRPTFNNLQRDIQRELRDTPDDFNQKLELFWSNLRGYIDLQIYYGMGFSTAFLLTVILIPKALH